MTRNRFKSRNFIVALSLVALQFLLVFPLTFTFMYRELAWIQTYLLILFVALTCLSAFFSGLALKRLGHSPWLGAIGLWISFVPIILYAILADKSSPAA